MIPVTNTIVQTDDLPGEEIEFTIGDPRFVMRTQADLYSDVTTAIIREYSTNAYDAHVMAGHTDPIEVTLPSLMNDHQFVVRDHGVGMDISDFRDIYTKFGTSNKRHSNSLNGQLGYGSKSGVAYTTQFTVVSVKDGIKNEGIVMRKPDWSIVLKIVATTKTTEPNGTTITIPVHNVQEFNHKAQEFYKFWLPGRVLVNGKAPVHAVGKKIIDNLYYSESWNTSYVVMGNVAYRIENPDALFRSTNMNRINFVAYVDEFKTTDGGAPVEFTPSREDLKYTERTKATLQTIVDDFEKNILKVAQKDIDDATSHFDAYMKWNEWSNMLGRGLFKDLEYDGDKFESAFAIAAQRWSMSGYRNSVYRVSQYDVAEMSTTMVVTDFDVEVSSNTKAKAREFAKFKHWPVSRVLFTAQSAKDITSVWISRDQFIAWADLKAQLPKKARPVNTGTAWNSGRLKGSFDYFTKSGAQYQKTVPATASPLYFVSVQDEKTLNVPDLLKHLNDDGTVVLLGANRVKKFHRDYPHVIDFKKHVQSKVVVKAETLLSEDAKTLLSIDANLVNWMDTLPVAKIDDPEWQRINALRANRATLLKAYDANQALANKCGMMYTVEKYSPSGKSYGLLTKYPLLGTLNYWNTRGVQNEVVLYMNAKHASI